MEDYKNYLDNGNLPKPTFVQVDEETGKQENRDGSFQENRDGSFDVIFRQFLRIT